MTVVSVVRSLAIAILTAAVLSVGAVSSAPVIRARCVGPVIAGSVHPAAILPTPPDPCQGR